MNIDELALPPFFIDYYQKFKTLTPIQEKAINAGLLKGKSLLICAPTASGKTLVATMGIASNLLQGKALYVVPLKALAKEKYTEYTKLFASTPYKVTIATGDIDSPSEYLSQYDLLILTTEKLDALLRHKAPWLSLVKVVVIDEVHLLHDQSRGPTLEIIITLLKMILKPQLIALSATIGNPKDLAQWLEAELVEDSWRPVELKKGIFYDNKTEFYE